MKKNILELFAGSRSIGKVGNDLGYCVISCDLIQYDKIDIIGNILDLEKKDFEKNNIKYDIIWASPPCTTFSIAGVWKHWKNGKASKEAKIGLKILDKTIKIISEFLKENPEIIYYIENPRGLMRKKIDDIFNKYGVIRVRHTITYCQYGCNNMKPTDIWTNNKFINFKKPCNNGDKCHISAPRNSRTGIQGLNGSYNRSKIPRELCLFILNS